MDVETCSAEDEDTVSLGSSAEEGKKIKHINSNLGNHSRFERVLLWVFIVKEKPLIDIDGVFGSAHVTVVISSQFYSLTTLRTLFKIIKL